MTGVGVMRNIAPDGLMHLGRPCTATQGAGGLVAAMLHVPAGWLACGLVVTGMALAQAPAISETVLLTFANSAPKGASPYGGVFRDSAGNLYGTASTGGSANAGVVF